MNGESLSGTRNFTSFTDSGRDTGVILPSTD